MTPSKNVVTAEESVVAAEESVVAEEESVVAEEASVVSSATGETFPITSYITCTSSNIIYDLYCQKCRHSAMANPGSDQYTGKSRNSAAERFSGHKSDINTGKLYKAVASHFNQPGHKTSDLRILPFETVRGNDPFLLASREQYWIRKKKTFELGINRQK